MIPKIIHYCWFGGKPKPKLAEKCIASWKKYCPDYEIMEWNEDNFDISAHPYAAYCHGRKNWAFLSDYVRLAVVAEQGGIYFDTDVELVRSPEALRKEEAFFGFELTDRVNTGLGFGAEPGHGVVRAMLEKYQNMVPDEDGTFPLVVCTQLNTQALAEMGLIPDGTEQTVAGARILPADWLNPYEYTTGRMFKTDHTMSIHWYNQSWISPAAQFRSKLTRPFHRLFGTDCFRWMKKEKEL